MNIHKIDSHLHQSFLEEERKDAITGDLIQANDEVVFCGICKSAFLKDSWEYMDKKHCGQYETLESIPISVPLLFISKIIPRFITPINSSISYEKCLEILSDFNPKSRKVMITLEEKFRKSTEQYKNLLKKTIELENDNKTQRLQMYSKSIVLAFSLFFISILAFIIIYICSQTTFAIEKITTVISILLLIYLFAFKKIMYLIDKLEVFKNKKKFRFLTANSDSLGNQESIMFGIYNCDLLFYFEATQQIIFIDFTQISQIEIDCQSINYIYITLKTEDNKGSSVKIPVVFTNKKRITAFLIKLAKTKNKISNESKILLINFPQSSITFLKRKLKRYNDFVFIRAKKFDSNKIQRNSISFIENLLT